MGDEVPAAVKEETGPPPVCLVAPRHPDALQRCLAEGEQGRTARNGSANLWEYGGENEEEGAFHQMRPAAPSLLIGQWGGERGEGGGTRSGIPKPGFSQNQMC